MEELRRSLAQAKFRYLISEADKEAEIAAKNAERARASRYRSILSELMGEGDTGCPDAAHRPQTSGLGLTPSDASAHFTSPALSSSFARNTLVITEPLAQPVCQPTSPPNTQPASHVNDVANMTDSRRSAGQRNAPVPSASTSRRGPKASTNCTNLAEIFTRAGVTPFELTRDEIIRANDTPGISWRTFSGKFGGGLRGEWPKCGRIPGYTRFLCADITAQPYVPMAPGKPGLVLRLPTTIFTPQDDGHTFHVFSSRDGLIHYQGEYARSGLQVELDWDELSASCRAMWMKRISSFGRSTAVIHALEARIVLRNKFKREPSSTEIDDHLMRNSNDRPLHRVVSMAFQRGEEKFVGEAVQCVAYDANLATIVQRSAREDSD